MLAFFQDKNLSKAVAQLFENLQVPLNLVSDAPTTVANLLENHSKTDFNDYTRDAYFVGAVNDEAFEGIHGNPLKLNQLRGRKYDFILIFAIEIVRLDEQNQPILPTRSQLFGLARAFNRAFPEQPVILVLRYCETFISIAVCERLPFAREDKQGDKIGKMSLLRDVNVLNPHAGHLRILKDLQIPRTGKNAVNSFESLYQYWLEKLNVSVLNQQFYEELSNWYFWAVRHVQFPNEPTDLEQLKTHRANNVIRLITRLIFTWFLKEKKLISDDLFDLEGLQNKIRFNSLTPDESTDSIYYQAVLQNLFFATLNQEMTERRFRKDAVFQGKNDDFNIKNVYRYASFFKKPQDAFDLFQKIPFLNGGLFECLDDDRLGAKGVTDGFSDNPKRQAKVPTFLFFQQKPMEVTELNEEYGTKGKKYKVRGILSILNDYKFTIAENTPLEQEIALDPELLGRIFENLLASYNPETKSSARKQTGSFYTPREIVNYMVDESLIGYLQNKLKFEDEQSLRNLFDEITEHSLDEMTVLRLIAALDNCKMLDPACGSGAFPMGILHRMVHLLHKLDPRNERWKERQLEKAEYIEDATAREDAMNAIEKAFEHNELDYGRKLYLIENCIYGVDIQPIAVQIAKLRFFISLLCDQKVNDAESNRGVLALPNLETKFVAANTLIGLDNVNLAKMAVEDLMTQRAKLRRRIFNAKRYGDKKRYREQDEQIRAQIKIKLDTLGMGGQTEQLVAWNPFDQNASAPFFDADWMFNVSGFDLVIGNPPYVQIQKLGAAQQRIFMQQGFKTFSKTGDLYELFYEKGVKYLASNGILTFITSNKWMRAHYGLSTRSFFSKFTRPLKIIDFGNVQIFESATVDTNLLFLQNATPNDTAWACRVDKAHWKDGGSLTNYVQKNQYLVPKLSEQAWIIGEKDTFDIKTRVETQGIPLKDWDIEINYGVKTGFNEAFILSQTQRDVLITADPKNEQILKPILRGRDIQKFYPELSGMWLIATLPSLKLDINAYPTIRDYLLNTFGIERLQQAGDKNSRKKTGNQWFETQDSIDYYKNFEKPKIIYPNMTKYLPFVYDEKDHFFTNDKGFILTGNHLKYLTAIFNSKLFKYCFLDHFPELQGGTRELRKVFFEKIPIKQLSITDEFPFDRLVEYVVFLKQQTLNTAQMRLMPVYFEQIIDGLVYELYFKNSFEAARLSLHRHLMKLPQVSDLNSITLIFNDLYDRKHPIRNAVFQMMSLPEVKLIHEKIQYLDKNRTIPENEKDNED
jgi:adenine-specific DNA-methyltransferase